MPDVLLSHVREDRDSAVIKTDYSHKHWYYGLNIEGPGVPASNTVKECKTQIFLVSEQLLILMKSNRQKVGRILPETKFKVSL